LSEPVSTCRREELKRDTEFRQVLMHLRRNRGAMVGLIVLAVFLICAVFAPLLAPYDPTDSNLGRALEKPSAEHILGTDELGRDSFSRILFGSRISLAIGLISVSIGLVVGVPLGALSGFYGGKFDLFMQRLIDILIAFPGILLAIVVVTILGVGVENVMIAVGVASIPIYTRLVRGSVLSVKEEGYVAAARALGIGNTQDYHSTYFAQLPGTDHRAVDIPDRHGHSLGRRSWIFGPGRPTPQPGVGGHVE